MFCKWCGMESVTTDQCSWCHRSLTSTISEPTSEEPKTEKVVETAEVPAAEASVPEPSLTTGEPKETPSKTPWTLTPSSPEPVAPPTASDAGISAMPIIPLKRPTAKKTGGNIPAPGMPPASKSLTGRLPVSAPILPQNATKKQAGTGTPNSIPSTPKRAPITPLNMPKMGAQETPTTAKTSRLAVPESLISKTGVLSPEQAASAGIAATPEAPTGGLAEGMAAPGITAAQMHVPEMGTFQATKSKYYSGQVIDPVSGTHYDSETGSPTAATQAAPATTPPGKTKKAEPEADEPEVRTLSLRMLVARFAGVFAILLLATFAFTYLHPQTFLIPLLVTQFLGGMLGPVMKAVPWQDEDSDDVVFFIILTFVFGPIVSLIIYSVVSFLRQNANPAIVSIMIVAALTRIAVELGAGTPANAFVMPWQFNQLNWATLFVNWSGFVGLAGWYMANVFHKLDE